MPFKVLFPLTLLLWWIAVAGISCTGNRRAQDFPSPGYWRDLNDPLYLLALERDRLIVSYDGRVREVFGILSTQRPEALRLCYSGREKTTLLRREGNKLVFYDPFRAQVHQLRRLRRKPEALSLTSFPLPNPSAIAEEKVQEIRKEIGQRSRQDQAALGHQRQDSPQGNGFLFIESNSSVAPKLHASEEEMQFADISMKNSDYLRGILLKVGWIDVKRFGYGTSNSAFLILQHGWDVSVMIAALPYLKEDVDRGLMESDTYALLYDRIQLALGLRQRYGTQIATTSRGEIFVLPVEGDPDKVDTFRRQLGLIPPADYVRIFGASTVQFSSECQP
jgi:hypothetical protein